MQFRSIFLVVLSCLLLSSCAESIVVRLQDSPENTGKIVLLPTAATQETFVTINGQLIVSNKYVNMVTIENAPEGMHHVQYSSYSAAYSEKLSEPLNLEVTKDQVTTKIIDVPPYNNGYWFYMGSTYVVSYIALFMLLFFIN
jgi:hypothetical protein